MCTWESPYVHSTLSLRSFPNSNIAFEIVPMFIWLMMALSHLFKEDSLALPLSMPLSSRQLMMWCPWLCVQLVVSQASQHFRSSEKQATCEGCFACHWCLCIDLLSHFCLLRHVQGGTPTWVFEGECQPLTHSSLGFPFHFSLLSAFYCRCLLGRDAHDFISLLPYRIVPAWWVVLTTSLSDFMCLLWNPWWKKTHP